MYIQYVHAVSERMRERVEHEQRSVAVVGFICGGSRARYAKGNAGLANDSGHAE
jgi:hypothetical protein